MPEPQHRGQEHETGKTPQYANVGVARGHDEMTALSHNAL
jgi:hypothetical protein